MMVAVSMILSLMCLFLTCLWLDRSISLAYSREDAESADKAIRGLERVLEREWRGLPEAEVVKRLRATFPKGTAGNIIVKKEGAIIWLDEVPFNIENGKLKSIGVR